MSQYLVSNDSHITLEVKLHINVRNVFPSYAIFEVDYWDMTTCTIYLHFYFAFYLLFLRCSFAHPPHQTRTKLDANSNWLCYFIDFGSSLVRICFEFATDLLRRYSGGKAEHFITYFTILYHMAQWHNWRKQRFET